MKEISCKASLYIKLVLGLPGAAARIVLLGLLRFYKVAISPLLPPSCRFQPTCSDYAREAVERHGAVKGAALAARRLFRCNPFFSGGHDPVP